MFACLTEAVNHHFPNPRGRVARRAARLIVREINKHRRIIRILHPR